ncbi:MAG: ABC transporter ATP-binding protein [Planctomycetota bacterium]
MSDTVDNILSVRDLEVAFHTLDGTTHAVRGNSFDVPRGQTVALVGESGSGKSVTSYSILRLIQKPGVIEGGSILFRPQNGPEIDLAVIDERDPRLFEVRGGKVGMIFQEPMTALSPVHSIGNQVSEALRLHRQMNKAQAWAEATRMLASVGIPEPETRMRQYPFEFSGGMRQRVVIAMALVCRPELLIADEPTTALDVTVQAQVLELINELKYQISASVIFITHDLGVVAQIADRVVVMNQGLIVETADVRTLYHRPAHPYTRRLLSAMPRLDNPGDEAPFKSDNTLPLPEGWSMDPPGGDWRADARGTRMQEIGPDHQVLLWPQSEAVTA